MRRLDWWLGVAALAFVVLFHAVFPRYEVRHVGAGESLIFVRIDRWTGGGEVATFTNRVPSAPWLTIR